MNHIEEIVEENHLMHLKYPRTFETKHLSGIKALDRILYWLAGCFIQRAIKHVNKLERLFLVSYWRNCRHQYLGFSCLQINKQSCILASGNHEWESHINFLLQSEELDASNHRVRDIWQFVIIDHTRVKTDLNQVVEISR